MNSRSFILSALIAGAVMGALANLPVLNLINCFLCLWVWVGGILAVYLYRRYEPGEMSLTGAQGAGLGAVAGLVGAFVGVIVFLLTGFISMPIITGMARFFEMEGDLPFETGGFPAVVGSALLFFMLNLIAYPLFGAISGLLGASLMGKKASPEE